MFGALETIQALVAPVVMISANGLLCLAFYNRLSAVINRSRTINKERFDLLARLSAMPADSRRSPEAEHVGRRTEILDELGHQLFERAWWLRGTLISLLVTVLCMLACSLALGLSPLGAWFDWAALGLFVVGVLVMMLGVLMAIQELRIALEPLLYEHERMEPPHAPSP
jgi:hypothetical protein